MMRLLARIFRRRKRERLPHAWLVQAAAVTADLKPRKKRQASAAATAFRKGWSR